MKTRMNALFPVFPALLLATTALAAPPDAGSVLRDELRREQAPGPVMPPKPDDLVPKPVKTDSGPKAQVNAFRLTGLRSVSENEAQAFLTPLAGQSYSLEGLHDIAAQLEKWLRARGLFAARAFIPPQDIAAGVVEIRILEGHVEEIDIKRAPGTRLPDNTLLDIVQTALPIGGPLDQEALERGTLLLNDLPATSARAVLAPGKEQGGSRIVVEAAQGSVPTGSLEIDNTGNRFTGEWRLGGAFALNDALGWGDQWQLRATRSEGSEFYRLGWSLPLGARGLRLGAALIESRYALCCDRAIVTTQSSGESSARNLFLSYPWIRTRTINLSSTVNLSQKSFFNRTLNGTASDKESESLSIGMSGDWNDPIGLAGQGAFSTYGVTWTKGNVDLSGWAVDKTQDDVTSRTHGDFDKLTLQASHLARISGESAIYAAFNLQWARKNLDSSEKFVLGGPQGVRAYPTGEATGDGGWLLNLEWRRELGSAVRAVAFIDHGEVKQHETTWANWNAGNSALQNRYVLTGIGGSISWNPTVNSQFSSTLASRVGKNPGRDSADHDSDNRPARLMLWLQGSAQF